MYRTMVNRFILGVGRIIERDRQTDRQIDRQTEKLRLKNREEKVS